MGSRFAMKPTRELGREELPTFTHSADRSLGRQEVSDVEREAFMAQIAQVIERTPDEDPRRLMHLEILEKKLKE